MQKYFVLIVFIVSTLAIQAQTAFISGPLPFSKSFGSSVTVLPNGNYVVHDSLYGNGKGAVHLYNGSNHSLISTLTGQSNFDGVGNRQIIVLSNSNFLLPIPDFISLIPFGINAGAVTFINGTTGLNGVVSASNSLVGSQTDDKVGADGITVLSNNNYVVRSQSWQNGSNQNAGAVTWGSGTTGVSGVVSSSNSLVGSNIDDKVGFYPVTQLTNGNYVVSSPYWNNTGVTDAGAVTWCSGTTGRSGTISSSNSLVGSTPFDQVGNNENIPKSGVTALTNGNYVVSSPSWDNGGTLDHAGAVTWASGITGITGEVNNSNSLVGSHSADYVGGFTTPLTNGNYVVSSPYWANGIVELAGAATWGNGTTGTTGEVSSSNSLVGSQQNDRIGNGGIIALTNGSYVVSSPYWANATFIYAGAATWANGITGIVGVVSSTNSLVGTKKEDFVGIKATALPNGHYVIHSRSWANGTATQAGASTWGNGNTGIAGVISSANSLVGTKTGDRVGGGSINILRNGNYLINSAAWGNGSAEFAGAVTWANGNTGITGLVSSTNSLVGTRAYDGIGVNDAIELTNGNYVISSPQWNNGAVAFAGAVTWGSGITGISGIVSNTNSLVGSHVGDRVGEDLTGVGVYALTNGNYIVNSRSWDNGSIMDAGASTWCNGNTGLTGLVNTSNSLVGSSAGDGEGLKSFTLPNSNYLLHTPYWNNGAIVDAGAVTWANGNTGIIGTISAANSLVGSAAEDNIGQVDPYSSKSGISILPNGNYIVQSRLWDNGELVNAGAVTFGNGSYGVVGAVNSCNSVVANAISIEAFPFPVAYNTTYNYMLVGRSVQSIVNIYNPTGMALGVHLDNVTQNITGNSPTAFVISNGCRIVASVLPTGITNPVSGYIEAKVWVQTTQSASFVKRHYQITPDDNAATATGKVTLYFTQQEFTDFNAVNTLKLPINVMDTANNKANLLIEKRTGVSSNGTGLPASYPTATAPVTINPVDTDIFYNSTFARWEVSFNVTGFSGFFVKTTAAITPVTYTFNGNGSWSNSSNWLGGMMPPAILTAPNEILIDPIVGGECVLKLSTAQTIATGAKIIVAAAKKFRVEGNLLIHQ